MKLSIIIPTCDRADALRAAYASISAQSRHAYEIIVIDDAGTRTGPAAARNMGARRATGDVVVFMDDDCVAAPDWLARMAEIFENESAVAASGAVIYRADGYLSQPGERAVHNPRGTWFMGANCAVRRDIFLALGGFPENYRVYEDKALALRLWSANHIIHQAPAARVYHAESRWTPRMYRQFEDHLSYWARLHADFDIWSDRNSPPPILWRRIVMPRDFAAMFKCCARIWDPHARARLRLLVRQRLALWRIDARGKRKLF